MGRIIQQNNGKTTVYVTGEDFNSLSPQTNTYYLGVNLTSGSFEKKGPDGSIIDFESISGGSGNFTGGTVSGETTFTNGVNADLIVVDTISATTYLNLVGGCDITDVTYSELVSLITGSSLSKGCYYIITDFQTCYDQPDFNTYGNAITTGNYRQGSVEPLVVFAVSESEIFNEVISPLFPNDKIKYDWTFNVTEVTSGIAYGRITERIDSDGNRTDYDHRNILFKRYNSYSLDGSFNGKIIQLDGTDVTGYDTDFTSSLNVGDVIFIPSNSEGFYRVVNIIDNLNMQVTGQTYYNFYYGLDGGLPFYACTFDTDNLPGTTYYFNDSGSNIINDGGNDMYDNGNSLNTNIYNTIPYTHTQMTGVPNEASIGDFIMDGSVQSGVGYFGASSNYFTNYYPGLFVMVADNTDVSYFETNGDLGADGGGSFDTYVYNTTVGGNDYTAYSKVVGDGGFDPSVNHIIIVNTDGTGLNHVVGSTTNDDLDKVENLNSNGVTQIHYLLTGLAKGVKLTEDQFNCMVDAYLALVDGNDINTILSNLNSNYSDVTVCLPPKDTTAKSLSYKQSNIVENTGYTEVLTFQYANAKNTYIGDFAKYNDWGGFTFLLSNNTFGNVFNQNSECFDNYIGDLSYNNSFGRDFNYNRLNDNAFQNIFYYSFYRNNISGEFINNLNIDNDFYDNEIGTEFDSNLLISDFYRNSIGNYFSTNIISDTFQNNEIGNSFNNNIIRNNFYKNDIGNGYNNNKIYSQFYGNLIGNAFNDNKFFNSFYDNVVGEYFENNLLGNDGNIGSWQFYRNKVGNNFNSNYIYRDFQNNQIGNQFQSNRIYGYFYKNVVGNGFNNNQNIRNEIYGNNIGNGFNGNRYIGNDFNTNTINDYFSNNKIGLSFSRNNVGANANGNSIGDFTQFSWYGLSNVTTRNYDNFANATENNYDYYVLGEELIMLDDVNSQYYKIKFTNWTIGNGGGFSYERTPIDALGVPSGPTIYFTKRNYVSVVDVIVPGVLEITRGNSGGIYNSAVEGSYTPGSPANTSWNSIYTSDAYNGYGASGNIIGDLFQSNKTVNYFSSNKIGNSCQSNNIGNNFGSNGSLSKGNVIGDEFKVNTIGNYFYDNKIGNHFINNTIGDYFESNQIGNYFGNDYNDLTPPVLNVILDNFKYNKIGDFFGNDTNYPSATTPGGNGGNLVNDGFQNNVIGDNAIYNIFDIDFENNNFGNSLWFNSFAASSFSNKVGDYFVGNVGSGGYPSSMGDSLQSNRVGNFMVYNYIDNIFKNNEIGDYFGNFFGNENIISGPFYSNVIGNYFGFNGSGPSNGNNITAEFYDNLIGTKFYNNTIQSTKFYRNDIGNEFFSNNLFSGSYDFHNNEIGNRFNANQIYGSFYGNQIGGGFNANTVQSNFYTNDIGFGFNNNLIGDGFNCNFIGYYYNSNTVGYNFYSNTVADYFGSNVVGNDFRDNEIKTPSLNSIDFSSATHVYGNYNCTIFKRNDGYYRLSYYDSSDVLNITNINS